MRGRSDHDACGMRTQHARVGVAPLLAAVLLVLPMPREPCVRGRKLAIRSASSGDRRPRRREVAVENDWYEVLDQRTRAAFSLPDIDTERALELMLDIFPRRVTRPPRHLRRHCADDAPSRIARVARKDRGARGWR